MGTAPEGSLRGERERSSRGPEATGRQPRCTPGQGARRRATPLDSGRGNRTPNPAACTAHPRPPDPWRRNQRGRHAACTRSGRAREPRCLRVRGARGRESTPRLASRGEVRKQRALRRYGQPAWWRDWSPREPAGESQSQGRGLDLAEAKNAEAAPAATRQNRGREKAGGKRPKLGPAREASAEHRLEARATRLQKTTRPRTWTRKEGEGAVARPAGRL